MNTALARRIAYFNKRVTNRLTRPLAPHLPGFGVIVHKGRTSGRTYETPVNVFRRDGDFVIALAYGAQSDWVKNVLAAGGCELVTRGRRYRLDYPRVVRDDSRKLVTSFARPFLRLVGAAEFIRLHRAG